jgi:hypothetical protein
MTIKRILILANSTKHHPMRCVAGCEFLSEGGGEAKCGGWVRPVSNHDEGALTFGERRLSDVTDPKPLDVVHIPLDAPENNPLQPENWLIDPGQPWNKETSCEAQSLISLVEKPDSLWLDPAQPSDRASAVFLQRLPNLRSLCLIRPETFQFHIRSRVWEGYAKKQQRGQFTYKGRFYDFALTDPLIGRKYFPDYPRTPEGDIQPTDPRRILLCVSLTPIFHELHYKVIATVFELAA